MEGRRHRFRHQPWIGQWSQVDPDHTIGKVGGNVADYRHSEARLPDAAGTGERQQRDSLVKQIGPCSDTLALPPDEAGARDREGRWQARRGNSDHAAFSHGTVANGPSLCGATYTMICPGKWWGRKGALSEPRSLGCGLPMDDASPVDWP